MIGADVAGRVGRKHCVDVAHAIEVLRTDRRARPRKAGVLQGTVARGPLTANPVRQELTPQDGANGSRR